MMTLYDGFVPSCLQVLGSVSGLLGKAEGHQAAQGMSAGQLIGGRIAPDMLDFAYQVKSCAVHSIGAIEGVRNGSFSPDTSTPPDSFDGLKARVAGAIDALSALTVADVEALSDTPVVFTIGSHVRVNFIGQDFLLSFSQPNFYFHATTAYNILRASGVAIGKRDYMGALRTQS